MAKKSTIILGAGYHGKVLARTIQSRGTHELKAFLDDNPATHSTEVCGAPVLGSLALLADVRDQLPVEQFAVGVGECHRFNDFLEANVPANPTSS